MFDMTAGHFVFIPAVLLFGVVIGWILGSRAPPGELVERILEWLGA